MYIPHLFRHIQCKLRQSLNSDSLTVTSTVTLPFPVQVGVCRGVQEIGTNDLFFKTLLSYLGLVFFLHLFG